MLYTSWFELLSLSDIKTFSVTIQIKKIKLSSSTSKHFPVVPFACRYFAKMIFFKTYLILGTFSQGM